METMQFSIEELAQLRAHGIVFFAGRVIFDAQPPISAAQLEEVQLLAGGKIPESLVELWKLTAGGRLDYALSATMHGRDEALSWCELFYKGSDGYRDLMEWIEYERELAEEAAEERQETWSGALAVLPFGGFEYCDRIYIVIDPQADDYGHVLAWKMGLPPAWQGAMHEDGLATIAENLDGAFRALRLDADPLEPTNDYSAGSSFLDYIDDRVECHGLTAALADKAIAFYRSACVADSANGAADKAAGLLDETRT